MTGRYIAAARQVGFRNTIVVDYPTVTDLAPMSLLITRITEAQARHSPLCLPVRPFPRNKPAFLVEPIEMNPVDEAPVRPSPREVQHRRSDHTDARAAASGGGGDSDAGDDPTCLACVSSAIRTRADRKQGGRHTQRLWPGERSMSRVTGLSAAWAMECGDRRADDVALRVEGTVDVVPVPRVDQSGEHVGPPLECQ
jgi:hypothetical protein